MIVIDKLSKRSLIFLQALSKFSLKFHYYNTNLKKKLIINQ